MVFSLCDVSRSSEGKGGLPLLNPPKCSAVMQDRSSGRPTSRDWTNNADLRPKSGESTIQLLPVKGCRPLPNTPASSFFGGFPVSRSRSAHVMPPWPHRIICQMRSRERADKKTIRKGTYYYIKAGFGTAPRQPPTDSGA